MARGLELGHWALDLGDDSDSARRDDGRRQLSVSASGRGADGRGPRATGRKTKTGVAAVRHCDGCGAGAGEEDEQGSGRMGICWTASFAHVGAWPHRPRGRLGICLSAREERRKSGRR